MRKRLMVVILVSVAAVPALAVAGPFPSDPEYGGKLEGKKNRYIGFDVKRSGDDRKIKQVFVINMAFDCEGSENDGPESGELEKAVGVKANGKFDKTVKYFFETMRGDEPRGLKYRLAGELDGKKAEGTLRIKTLGNGEGCDSGTQDFVAKKPAPPVPEPNFPIRD